MCSGQLVLLELLCEKGRKNRAQIIVKMISLPIRQYTNEKKESLSSVNNTNLHHSLGMVKIKTSRVGQRREQHQPPTQKLQFALINNISSLITIVAFLLAPQLASLADTTVVASFSLEANHSTSESAAPVGRNSMSPGGRMRFAKLKLARQHQDVSSSSTLNGMHSDGLTPFKRFRSASTTATSESSSLDKLASSSSNQMSDSIGNRHHPIFPVPIAGTRPQPRNDSLNRQQSIQNFNMSNNNKMLVDFQNNTTTESNSLSQSISANNFINDDHDSNNNMISKDKNNNYDDFIHNNDTSNSLKTSGLQKSHDLPMQISEPPYWRRNVKSVNGTIDLSQYEQSDVDRLYGDALLVYVKNFNE